MCVCAEFQVPDWTYESQELMMKKKKETKDKNKDGKVLPSGSWPISSIN